MPTRPPRHGAISLGDAAGRMDAAQRELLADYCRLVGRRLSRDGPAGRSGPRRDPAAALGLPPRLAQTLSGLLGGASEKQIALSLSISPHTVHAYVKQLHKRLNVSSRGELLARFIGADA